LDEVIVFNDLKEFKENLMIRQILIAGALIEVMLIADKLLEYMPNKF